MKLAVIGAGSSRLPLMLASTATVDAGLTDVSLYDIRPERISALLPAGIALAAECGKMPRITLAGSPEEALEGACAVVLTVRPGFETARALDERACLDRGVIGQETTGPAGMAFAARTIPVVTDYCRLAKACSPACIPVVFSNPAGMVTQALHRQGYDNAVGICDSAMGAVKALAGMAGIPIEGLEFEVFGLNHLSWTLKVEAEGRDLLGPALGDTAFLSETFPWFEPALLASMGRIPNEYLYYFYRAREALTAMTAEAGSRGETLVRANRSLFRDMAELVARGAVGDSLVRYADYLSGRNDSYMAYARDCKGPPSRSRSTRDAVSVLKGFVGGYAEVAMDLVTALVLGRSRKLALNVPNHGAVPWLADDDVIETDCRVDRSGIHPIAHPCVPDDDRVLVESIKEYEGLAVRAVLECSLSLAEDALAVHPLVASREQACELVQGLESLRNL